MYMNEVIKQAIEVAGEVSERRRTKNVSKGNRTMPRSSFQGTYTKNRSWFDAIGRALSAPTALVAGRTLFGTLFGIPRACLGGGGLPPILRQPLSSCPTRSFFAGGRT
jgi:hypothetical protein